MASRIRKPRTKRTPLAAFKDNRLENDPRFLRRVAQARKSLRAGRGVRLEDVKSGR